MLFYIRALLFTVNYFVYELFLKMDLTIVPSFSVIKMYILRIMVAKFKKRSQVDTALL